MEEFKKFRNFLNKDPILDVFNRDQTKYNKDDLDGNVLARYVNQNKSIFLSKIVEHISKLCELRVIYDEVIIVRSNDICKFIPGFTTTKTGYSLFTVEYATLEIKQRSGFGLLSNVEKQKKYLFKNWYISGGYGSNVIFDHLFVFGRKYKDTSGIVSNNVFYAAENKCDYTDLLQQCQDHLKRIDDNSYIIGEDVFPNMKNGLDTEWKTEKKKIADGLREITKVWRCGVRYRDMMVSTGVKDYTSITEFPNKLIRKIVLNDQDIDLSCNNTTNLHLFTKIYFVDFEILTNVYDDFSSFPQSNVKNTVFNIGCGYSVNSKFRFKSWVLQGKKSEKDIITELLSFTQGGVICHWTDIERRYIVDKIQEYNLDFSEPIFFDLYKYFVDNSITIKNCYNFKLKTIANCMYDMGMISCRWDTGKYSDGMSAMMGYIQYLNTGDKKILRDIVEYNRIDCKVLYEIYHYIKNNS